MIKKLSPKTVNLRLCGIRKYCEFSNFPFDVKSVKYQKKSHVENVMTIEQFNKLLSGLKSDNDTKWGIYYSILGKTGMRVSEFLKCKVKDLRAGRVTLKTKGKIREVIFPKKLLEEVLTFYKKSGDEEYICLNKRGHLMTSRGLSGQLKKHAIKYGIPVENAYPHSFRHLFAIEFLKRNNNVTLLADLLGHSSINTTMIYLRLSLEQQKNAIDLAVDW